MYLTIWLWLLDIGECRTSQLNSGEIRRCDKQIESLTRYVTYLESMDNSDSYQVTITNINERLSKWQKIKADNYDLIVQLESSDINLKIQSYKVKLDSLERYRKSLRIGHNQYKAHLLLHDFILKNGTRTQDEVDSFIAAYTQVIAIKRVSSDLTGLVNNADVMYNNLTKAITLFVTYHPFSIFVD
ncbi:hypothetical protein [Vibrio agarivorans]|uniref:hypothetical protein n=1 Tax=Vibrio agarivorans TaxID=153622 RepID=UPI0025B5EB7B|nr:hypothetical protein [Vibrio agarivorans]MDN3661106.1 hypothetical protein [Vibrio agarivorans]